MTLLLGHVDRICPVLGAMLERGLMSPQMLGAFILS